MRILGYGQEVNVEIKGEEIIFFHPMTNQPCEYINQIKTGWSFQSAKENENYDRLIKSVEVMDNDSMLDVYLIDYEEEGTFDIENTPYSL